MICVQFKIPNNESVLVGKYNGEKLEMTASEAAAAFVKHIDPMGLEVIVPRILPKEIAGSYLAPRIAGWRYYPERARSRSVIANSVIEARYGLSA